MGGVTNPNLNYFASYSTGTGTGTYITDNNFQKV